MAVTARPSAAVSSPSNVATRSVLLGFADALAAPEAAWSLLESGVAVTAFARRGSRPALRCCRDVRMVEITAPEDDALQSMHDLQELLGTGDFSALMPLDDASMWLCSRPFEATRDVAVAGPAGTQAALALDKRLQLDAAARAGFSVPATRCIESVDELLVLSELPLALKPALPISERDGRLVRAANYICANRAELESAALTWKGEGPLLAQPLIRGTGEGLFGLAGGRGLHALSAHRRIRMMNPHGSGSSACRSITVDRELADGAESMLREAAWRGLFMLEFLRDSNGTAWFMELNGRSWGSMALARRVGLEYPAWTLRQLADPDFAPAVSAADEAVVCRHLGRELIHLLMVLRGPKSIAVTDWPSRWRTVRDVLRIRRRERWYNWNPADWRLFVDDTVRTVLSQLPRRGRR